MRRQDTASFAHLALRTDHPSALPLSLGLGALLPCDVHNLGKLEISGVGGEDALGGGVGRGQADLGVDVEHALGSTWRPNNGSAVSLVRLAVISNERAREFLGGGALFYN